MMDEEPSAEFGKFEEIQTKLTRVLLAEGYSQPEAEEIGFFIAQAIRNVPPLLGLLDELEEHSSSEVMDAVYDVLVNRSALEEADKLLSGSKTR